MSTNDKIFKFSDKDDTDAIWIDTENNQYHIHQFLLALRSPVLRDVDFTKEPFETKLQPQVCLTFLQMLYSTNIDMVDIDSETILQLTDVFFKYDMKDYFDSCVRRLADAIQSAKVPLHNESKTCTLIYLSNQIWFSKSQLLQDWVVHRLRNLEHNFSRDIFAKLNPLVYEQYFLADQMYLKYELSDEIEYFEEEDKQWYLATKTPNQSISTRMNGDKGLVNVVFSRHRGDIDNTPFEEVFKAIDVSTKFVTSVGTHPIVKMKVRTNGKRIVQFKKCLGDDF